MDRKPDLVAVAGIEIGMRGEERVCFVRRRIAKAVDIMMAVAFGMGDADQRAEREILLHGKPGLAGQVFARDKELFVLRAPLGCTRALITDLYIPLQDFEEMPR